MFIFAIFCIDTGFHDIFGMKTFFLKITSFRSEKTFEFLISATKSIRISVKTFFLDITCFRPEKTFEVLISVGKSL